MLLKKDVYDAKMSLRSKLLRIEKPGITNLATNTAVNAKINDVKNEIPSITNLATNTALNTKINEVNNEQFI